MIKYIKKEVVYKDEIAYEVSCDICKKVIADIDRPKSKFWKLTTMHNDWGNDSCDSIETFEICSKECIIKALERYFKKCEHSCTREFNLEQDYICINTECDADMRSKIILKEDKE